MPTLKKASLVSICFFLFLFSNASRASLIEFHFTGQLTVLDLGGGLVNQTGVDSTFSYDTNLGVGSGDLVVSPITFFGMPLSIYDISMQDVGGNLLLANMLADWGPNIGLPVSMVWDATGLINAIDLGLQAGDVISGTTMKRNDVFFADVGSATPASDINQPGPIGGTYRSMLIACRFGICAVEKKRHDGKHRGRKWS